MWLYHYNYNHGVVAMKVTSSNQLMCVNSV